MAGSDGFSTNADLIGEAFAALAESLKAELHPFTNQISMAVEADITTLYGPRLGALWTVKDDVDVLAEGELAHIQAATDDYRVLGYEDGIRPHEIWAHHIALRFDKNGELLYRQMVHHPGTKGKHLAPTLEEDMTALAQAGWEEALDTILIAWEDGL